MSCEDYKGKPDVKMKQGDAVITVEMMKCTDCILMSSGTRISFLFNPLITIGKWKRLPQSCVHCKNVNLFKRISNIFLCLSAVMSTRLSA